MQVLWQFDNLGLGNRARVRQQEAERSVAVLELFRLQDRIAAEVAQAHAQADLAGRRVGIAEQGLRLALDSYDRNLEGLGQTRLIGGVNVTVVRPQEVLAAVQAVAQAYTDFYGAVADSNRAQFRLYRALGHPAKCLLDELARRAAEPGP